MAGKPDEVSEAPKTPSVAELLARLEAQSLEIEQLKAKGAQFVPMHRDPPPQQGGYRPPEHLERSVKTLVRAVGDEAQGRSSWNDDPQFRNSLPPQFRPVFSPGNLVRLKADAIPHGGVKTFREIYGDAVNRAGEVLGMLGRMPSYEPKYRVRIEGVTGRHGDGYAESELTFA